MLKSLRVSLVATLALLGALSAGGAQAKGAAASSASSPKKEKLMADIDTGKDLYATLDTTLGTIVLKLYTKEAPKTVANFVGLATGAKPWTDRKSGESKTTNFYDGLTFHRVIPGFMAQGGDPMGSGMGDPGYKFEDENQGPITKAGVLAMANAGPNTNGSQFFITEVPQPRLTTYNRFGEVVSGQDIVYAITHTKTGQQDRPVTPVLMKKVTISETAPKS